MLFIIAAIIGSGVFWLRRAPNPSWPVPAPLPLRLTLPYGMAPPAFKAFVRACHRAKIHPWRIGQTIGEHPLSVGYHRQDGVWRLNKMPFDYCAAVDLGTSDLNETQIKVFLEELAKQGFASFYRHGGKWKGREHIHAIYALLPMKIQLRRQVREFLRERRAAKKPNLKWAKRWR